MRSEHFNLLRWVWHAHSSASCRFYWTVTAAGLLLTSLWCPSSILVLAHGVLWPVDLYPCKKLLLPWLLSFPIALAMLPNKITCWDILFKVINHAKNGPALFNSFGLHWDKLLTSLHRFIHWNCFKKAVI